MTELVLEFLPEALADAEKATRYNEECLAGLGVRFRKELESHCADIIRHASRPTTEFFRGTGRNQVSHPISFSSGKGGSYP